MKDRSKNRPKAHKTTSSQSSQNGNHSNKKGNESTVKSAKQQNTVITTASASTKPESRNATNCDSGESFAGSKNGNVVSTTTKVIQNYSATEPTSDETDRSTTMVDSNSNTISVDTTPNRDIKSDVVSSNNIVATSQNDISIDTTTSTSTVNVLNSTQNCNAQTNQMPSVKFQSNFRNKIMDEMKNASVESTDSSPHLLQKQTSLTYSDGQWSPNNADGKKFYNRDQLIMLRDQPASQFEPNFAGRLSAIAKTNTNQQNMSYGCPNNLLPKFMVQGNFKHPGSQRNSNYTKRASQTSMQPNQQSSQTNGNANKGSKTDMIRMSLSLHEDVKLNETDNKWVPSFLKKEMDSDSVDNDLSSIDLLLKRVRGVLNKLTPERFETLFEEIKNFNIDTVERLNGVIFLVFEKAIDEPNFSSAYAKLCNELSQSLADAVSAGENKSFKKTLISKCQNEFEQHVVHEKAIIAKLAPFLAKVNEAENEEKKAEYQANLEDEERKLRRRSVGTVRFIGELYKIGLLTVRIMITCIKTLIRDRDSEDKLECLCKLLTTVGKKLEEEFTDIKELNEAFIDVQAIVGKKIPNLKISSRVRFMLQDVIDLRNRRWIPRRNDVNPKTMGQIQKEADDEQQTINLLNYYVSGRRDDRVRNDNRVNGNYQKPNREEGWMTSKSRSHTFDPSKMRSRASIDDNTSLGAASQFKWGQNSNNSTSLSTSSIANSGNTYAALDPARKFGSSNENTRNNRGRDNYHSKGSMDRYQYADKRNSRSGSQHNSRENSLARNYPPRNAHHVNRTSQSMHGLSSTHPPSMPIEKHIDIPNVQLSTNTVEPSLNNQTVIKTLVKELLENHHISEVSLADCHIGVDTILNEHRWVLVREMLNAAVEIQRLRTLDRTFAGRSIHQWIKMKLVTVKDMLNGLKSFLEPVEDISLDIPHIWLYIAEIIAPLIENDHLKLCHLKLLCPDYVHRILEDLLPYLISVHGEIYVKNILKLNELSDLLPVEQISTKLKNIVTTLTAPGVSQSINKKESVQGKVTENYIKMDDVQRHIKKLLKENVKLDDIYDFITANVTEIDSNFIRTLTTAVVDTSLDNRLKLDEKQFQQRFSLLERYIDGNEPFELQCLIAIQILVNRLEHPQGLMQNMFSLLVTEKIVSVDSIIKWKHSNDVMEGKGVAVTYLRSFFDILNEMNGGEVSSEDEDN